MSERKISSPIDVAKLRDLWPTPLTDKEIAAALGHHRSVIRRKAGEIGLPPRYVARRQAFETRA